LKALRHVAAGAEIRLRRFAVPEQFALMNAAPRRRPLAGLSYLGVFFLSALGLHADLRWDATETTLRLPAEDLTGRARFTFVNDGTDAIDIARVEPGCGCTAALPAKTHIEPGEKGEIPVEFHRGHREGTARIPINVYVAKREVPTVLQLVVEMEDVLNITPRFVFWQPGEARTAKSMRLTITRNHDVEIVDVSCGNARFTAQLEPYGTATGQYNIVVVPPPLDALYSTINVRTRIGKDKVERVFSLLARTL
jgi:hypothetical protein